MTRCLSTSFIARFTAVFVCALFSGPAFSQNGFTANAGSSPKISESGQVEGNSSAELSGDNILGVESVLPQDVPVTDVDSSRHSVPLAAKVVLPEATRSDTGKSSSSVPAFESQKVGRRVPDNFAEKNATHGSEMNPDFSRTAFVLAGVLALIVLIAWLFKRYIFSSRRGGSQASLKILVRSSISPRQSLCLVKLGNRLLLVGLSPGHMTTLHAIEDPDEIAMILGSLENRNPASISNTFNRIVSKEAQEYDGYPDDSVMSTDDIAHGTAATDQIHQAHGELSGLLDKVRGLTRMHSRH